MPIRKLNELFEVVKQGPKKTILVVSANDDHTLTSVNQAVESGLVNAILIGDQGKIAEICRKEQIDHSQFQIIHQPDDRLAATLAVEMINRGEGQLLMKGLISTDKFIKAILDKEKGLLLPGNILSHITAVENPNYYKLLIVSDVAVLPQPDLSQKLQQIRFLIEASTALGITNPKIAVIAPSEQVLLVLESSKDAALLAKMNERGQIAGCYLDGPMALDVAIDPESAKLKGVKGSVAGDADCLLFPNLDTGNVFYKTNMKLAGAESAAILTGAKVPVVLSSRGDSSLTKLYSIALAALMSNN
jgi:phosphate butyryltransferase